MYFEKLVYAETHLPYHEIEQTRSLRQYSGLYSVATKYYGENNVFDAQEERSIIYSYRN